MTVLITFRPKFDVFPSVTLVVHHDSSFFRMNSQKLTRHIESTCRIVIFSLASLFGDDVLCLV